MTFLELLAEAEAELPFLLGQDGWESKLIDYTPPKVERIYRTWRDQYRLSLHRIHPCEPEHAFWHPHPWDGAFTIIQGQYEMAIGTQDKVLATMRLPTGSRYEMMHPDGYHSVRPLDSPAVTLMLTGPPRPLTDAPQTRTYRFSQVPMTDREALMSLFWRHYNDPFTGLLWLRRPGEEEWTRFTGAPQGVGQVALFCEQGNWPGTLDLATMKLLVRSRTEVREHDIAEIATEPPPGYEPPEPPSYTEADIDDTIPF